VAVDRRVDHSPRNRGTLAEGYYDPATKHKADETDSYESRPVKSENTHAHNAHQKDTEVEDEEEDEYGPSLPGQMVESRRIGPAVPGLDDIQQRRGKQECAIKWSIGQR